MPDANFCECTRAWAVNFADPVTHDKQHWCGALLHCAHFKKAVRYWGKSGYAGCLSPSIQLPSSIPTLCKCAVLLCWWYAQVPKCIARYYGVMLTDRWFFCGFGLSCIRRKNRGFKCNEWRRPWWLRACSACSPFPLLFIPCPNPKSQTGSPHADALTIITKGEQLLLMPRPNH